MSNRSVVGTMSITAKAQQLIDRLRQLERCLVAFSGGVDSAVVAKAAVLAQGECAIAVTAVSPSLAAGELAGARNVAIQIGIRHELIDTQELENPLYVANQFDRCFHCKTELYQSLRPYLQRWPDAVVVNGANLDDLGDYRPGMQAARDFQVLSPLVDCGLGKNDVRELARLWSLPVADKPATPCLSSRLAYGEEVTLERLRMIDQAEAWLRERGLSDVRVRYHRGDLARLEVEPSEIARLATDPFRRELTETFERLGFKFITLDLHGRRSGSLNAVVPLEQRG